MVRIAHAATRTTAGLVLVVALAALASFAAPERDVRAADSISGRWLIVLGGDFAGTCEAVIVQEAETIVTKANCPILGDLSFEGTIDGDGNLAMTDGLYGIVAEAQASPEGSSMVGNWSALGLQGTLTGTRTSPDASPVDVSGEWKFIFQESGEADRTCGAMITQSSTDLTAVVTCPTDTTTWLGISNALSGAFSMILQGEVRGGLRADPSLGSSIMSGDWESAEGGGVFFAVREGASHKGILTLRCLNELGQFDYCAAGPGQAVSVSAELILPPTTAYNGFSVTFRATGNARYVSADLTNEAPGCSAPRKTVSTDRNATLITVNCAPGAANAAATQLAEISFRCPQHSSESTHLSFDWNGTYLTISDVPARPVLAGATSLLCYAGPPTLPPEAFLQADVNCDGRTNAVDAALVLQLDAGLIQSLPCGTSGDTSMDGETNSIDATVILQMTAGLVQPAPEPLPVI